MKKLLILLLFFTFINTGLLLTEQKIYKRSVIPNLNSKFKLQLKELGEKIRRNKKLDTNTLNQWKQLVTKIYKTNKAIDINLIVHYVLRESYLYERKNLKFYASRVKYLNNLKGEIRNYIKELRNYLHQANLNPKSDKILIKLKDFSPAIKLSRKSIKFRRLNESGKSKLLKSKINFHCKNIQVTHDSLTDEISQMEEKLKKIGDDAQLASIDLQNMLQKLQQTIQTLSNVSKALRETAYAVIRKRA